MSNKAPVLFLLLTALLALSGLGIYCLADPSGKEAAPMPDITVITASDLHYIAPGLTDHGAYFENMISDSDGKVMDYIEELTDAFLDEVIRRGPEALILSGDLTFNGARESHEALAEKLRAVTGAGIPVLVIPGNHDLENRNAARFRGDSFTRVDSVTAEEFAAIYAGCGYGSALSRDAATLSYTYELAPGLRVLLLDVNIPESKNIAPPETVAWAEAQLRDAREAGAKVIAVSHQNLMQHNSLIVDGYLIENAGELLDLYREYGVIANFCGHLHCQHIRVSGGGIPDIATSALSVYPNQYGVISLTEEAGRYDTARTDVSAWAAARGLTDPALLDFAAWSRAFFRSSGRDAVPDPIGGSGEPGAGSLAEFAADINEAYFSGRMDTIDPDDPRFGALAGSGGFMAAYLLTTLEDGPADFNHYILY